ncbi:hypothetical protein BDV96DRAFT_617703 [Lophiotrema nucula]|uniref:Uncharacterized protein n=1 Tax=Lophiotrema nucula TaxID=690887 RepID=A0A6A5YF05_9PLEO|nr:hypothetical protein BDV96DRAFT_617703 [Lophiotrema nucula]
MRVPFLVALIAPLSALALPAELVAKHAGLPTFVERQAPAKPSPCQPISPAPTGDALKARADAFAQAFIYKKNITEAFTYINKGYINHNPAAQNGFDSAWSILSPIWGQQSITPLRTAFTDPQSWLNYQTGSFGEVVDRYRWEAGCIAEHWDQGEKFPTNATVF